MINVPQQQNGSTWFFEFRPLNFEYWCLFGYGHRREAVVGLVIPSQIWKVLIVRALVGLSSRMNHPGNLAVSTLVAVGIALTGCSNSSRPATYPVTGTVTLQGKPVAGAAVTFVPTGDEGEAASAITDSEGKYALTTWQAGDGARPGEYRVKVSKQEVAAVDPSKMVKNLSIEEEQ